MRKKITLWGMTMLAVAALAWGATGPAFRSIPQFLAGLTAAGDVEISGATLTEATWAAADQNLLEAIPKIGIVALGTMTNGTTENICYVDDSPDGEWADVESTDTITLSAATTHYMFGAKSLGITFAAGALADEGAVNDITNDDLSDNESIGFWVWSTTTLAEGDLYVLLDDDDADPDPTYDVPLVIEGTWTWVELDVSGCQGTSTTDCDVVDTVSILQADALGYAYSVYVDTMYKWDADNEEALSLDLIGPGSVLGVATIATAEGTANTPAMKTEGTDFLVNWQSGNDVLVTITDQSANSGLAIVAYQ